MPRTRAPGDKGQAARPPHGGRRPGSGAPKGNLNALKTGRYSRRVRVLRQAFGLVPGTSDFIRRYLAAQEAERALYADVLHQGVYPERSRRTDLIRVIPALIQSAKRRQIDLFQIHKLLENSKSNQTTKSHPPEPAEDTSSMVPRFYGSALDPPFAVR